MNEFDSYFQENSVFGKQLLWEHTIYQAVLLFCEAEKRIRDSELQNYYSGLEGWWRPTAQKVNGKKGYKVPEETAVSEAIVEQMEVVKKEFILSSGDLNPDIAGIDNLEFHAEAPRNKKTGIGRRAKPTDFRFYRSGIGGFDLRIEAKVITKNSEVKSHYLSKEGLGRFSDSREPYTDDLVGGMVAYTMTESEKVWEERIKTDLSLLNTSIQTFHHAVHPHTRQILFSKVPFSHLDNPNRNEVLVFHFVLEFDCSPSAR